MSTHRIQRDELDLALRQLVRTGHRIDYLAFEPESQEWVVLTEDSIEEREFPRLVTMVEHADGTIVPLGGAE
jgi:hypothetical protein